MTLLSILFIVITFAFGITLFFGNAPQIGEKSKGERLKKIENSPNYKNGIFVNTIPTELSNPFKIMRKVGREFFFDTKKREPEMQIQSIPMNLDNFMGVDKKDFGVFWLGHSTMLIRFEGKTLLIDPVFGKRASMFSFSGPKRFDYSHIYKLEELPEIDAVILSHDHYDHLDYESIVYLKDKVDKFYMPIGVGAHLEKWGVPAENINELDWWDDISFDESLRLTLTPTRHFSGRGLSDRNKTLWGSWVINGENNNIYFSGDSGYFPGFKEIGEKYGPFDVTFMECGAYNENDTTKELVFVGVHTLVDLWIIDTRN